MNILSIIFIAFVVLESLNVLTLYFMPGTKKGNGIGVFKAWEKSKADPVVHELLKYLVYWVAGTKLIFIALLIVILITGGPTTKLFSAAAMIVSILSFYWKLFPIIRHADERGEISPKGYSKILGIMIAAFVLMFAVALGSALAG